VQYARHLLFRGRNEDAISQLRVARVEDPASALVLGWLSYAYLLSGQTDSALAESQRALENDSTSFSTLSQGAFVRLAVNRPDEALKLIARLREPVASMWSTYVIAKAGDTTTARRRLQAEDAEVPQPRFAELRRASSNLGLGDTARALDALERATASGYIWTSWTPISDPRFDAVRESPRFKALLRRVNLSDVRWRR
jgi:tetratricopeptide (TPR) repeat protein